MPGDVVHTQGLTKYFGSVAALDGFDLRVGPGEVHGFLGPNGAGKSTTLRILLGMLKPDSGIAEILGADAWSADPTLRRRVAYVPGDVSVWPSLTGGETIDLLLRLRGIDPVRSNRDALIGRFDFDPCRKGRTYSRGNRQKIALISALASPVELLLLDEPTAGLDPLMELEFTKCVHEAVEQGATVLLSSHILSEVERLADHVTIIRQGRAVESGRLEDLRQLRKTRVRVEYIGELTGLLGLADVEVVDLVESRSSTQVTLLLGADGMDELLKLLIEVRVVSLVSEAPSLEELFLDAYRSR
ncbi:MAG TPA: ABC transporter ATP-binding protein [Marmoricola sp.]|nr:ABC transporter ATP-binding protein [Nocardioidaceae bacterium]MCO5323576.1 ABC transporter ATP-binding protein [Nocardioidaceae bacterium]HRV67873.1 ABC transporter ATP-binding protein [Marmoricola sp.]